ncbi:MAG TPA: TlpA disulfide reductase family protein [Chitinophagaceae bacterium]|nr:TlpA disulfide reductase family protein [Chitinophagaceae bacterium]
MKPQNFFLILLLLLCIGACKNESSSGDFTVTANFKNAEHPAYVGQAGGGPLNPVRKVQLYEIPFGMENSPVIVDSAVLTGDNGKVELKGRAKDEGLYQLVFDNGFVVLLSNDQPQIQIDIDLSKKENYYAVRGSEASQQMEDFTVEYTEKSQRVNKAFAQMDSLKRLAAPDSLVMAATAEKNGQIKSINEYLKSFINKSTHPSVALFVLGWASRSFTRPEFESALNEVVKKFPANPSVMNLKKTYDLQQAQVAADMQRKQKEYEAREQLWVGKMAPDLALPDQNGEVLKVSSFRGKYVLVDFWASWCRPCRLENPNVVNAFNRYKNKNFTILGVSLDKDKDDWQQAIADDQLAWSHISDLKFWNSKAVDVYKFDGIPFNILIDPTGKVVAESLRGEQLENKLKEVLSP